MRLTLWNQDGLTRGSQVHLERAPGAGEVRQRLQTYTLAARTAHVDKQNRETAVLSWETLCSDCGKPFAFKTGLRVKGFVRRCKACREITPYEFAGWTSGPRNHWIVEPASEEAEEVEVAMPRAFPLFDALGSAERVMRMKAAKDELGPASTFTEWRALIELSLGGIDPESLM